MATITLTGGAFGCTMGMGAFEGIGTAFTSVKSSSGSLTKALGALKSKINLAMVVAKIETPQEQAKKAEERESTKKSSLSLAYEKLNTLISDTGSVDMKASSKIRERKDAFYDRYYYLKPECEKTKKEKYNDWKASVWEGICDIGKAIADFCINVAEWVKEHWVAIVTAIVVIVIAVVAAVFLGPAAIIAICSAIAFFCSAADLVAVLVTGKDVYTLLKESGHPILAELFAGLQWGTTIAAVALSFVQLGAQIGKVGLKSFLTGGEKGIWNIAKYHFKNFANGIKSDFKSIFGKGLKMGDRLKATWNIVVLNQSGDFNLNQSIMSYQSGEAIIRAGSSSKHIMLDEQGNYVPKSQELKDVLASYGFDTDVIHTRRYGNSVDFDWDYYGSKAGTSDFMSMYSNNKNNILGGEFDLRTNFWGDAEVDKIPGMTRHELYNVEGGYVSIYQVPTEIHQKLSHNGGTSVVQGIWEKLGSGTLFMEQRQTIRRIVGLDSLDSILTNSANQFYQWDH